MRIDHDQRYCKDCKQMYEPDALYGIPHECIVAVAPPPPPPTPLILKFKNISKIREGWLSRKPLRTNGVIPGKTVLKQYSMRRHDLKNLEKSVFDFPDDAEDLIKENIPLHKNKNEKVPTSLREKNRSTELKFRCIFCLNGRFNEWHLLDCHLNDCHDKKLCETCGDIYNNEEVHLCCGIPPDEEEDEPDIEDVPCVKDLPSNVETPSNDDDTFLEDLLEEEEYRSIQQKSGGEILLQDEIEEIESVVEVASTPPVIEIVDEDATDGAKYECYKCNRTYKNTHSMVNHLITHSKRNPYKCNDCGQRFKIFSKMSKHIELKHAHKHNRCVWLHITSHYLKLEI